MMLPTAMVVIGVVYAAAVNAAAAKRGEDQAIESRVVYAVGPPWGSVGGRKPNSEDFFFRQLRSPFERKLKGTRRGCSAYGHSCFGGYGKRGAVLPLHLATPLPLPLPLSQPRGRERDGDGEDEEKALSAEHSPLLQLLKHPLNEAGDMAFVVLRQSPVSSRTPLFVRPMARLAPATQAAPAGEEGALASWMASGLDGHAMGRPADLSADTDEENDPSVNNMASRMFLRRWLRTYRRPTRRSLL